MDANLKIIESTGRKWELILLPNTVYTIGRAKENDIILNDQRVSRHHAHIRTDETGCTLIDGYYAGSELRRSVNKVFFNGIPLPEKRLENGDEITIGGSKLEFQLTESFAAPNYARQNYAEPVYVEPNYPSPDPAEPAYVEPFFVKPKMSEVSNSRSLSEVIGATEVTPVAIPEKVKYDDRPLGHTQMLISASEIIGRRSNISIETSVATPDEIKELRRKAQILELLYEMSRTLGTVFDLKEIFVKATDLIFRGTPAERVVALIADESLDGKILDYSLNPIAVRARDSQLENSLEKLTVSRTITQKVMREKVALLSQDAKSDAEFSNAESIVAQGVRSTICAPLITESNVHGVVYADRLDPFAVFTEEDLELISAVAAQIAVTVETVKAHKRLAREEVARANYSRFMPEYVVKQMLDNPNSFRLGGINQTITVLFADIRGFTSLSENEKPEKVVTLLNLYFSAMSEIIFEFGGTLDKYIGDGLMAIFGAPNASPNDAKHALQTAIAMQKRLMILNKDLRNEGFSEVQIGIGLHTGEATIGYIGSEKRSEYTAIGDTVNLAARLESNARPGQILISEATVAACNCDDYQFIVREPLTVKNRIQPVSLFEVGWN